MQDSKKAPKLSNSKSFDSIRHSLAHLLADTVKEIWPGSLNAIGPSIEDGFYQDFELNGKISEEDLPKIEGAMRKKLKDWQSFVKKEVTLEEAKEIFNDNKYKIELAEEFTKAGKKLTVYSSGGFDDLCKGGHSKGLSKIDPKSFKLTHTAGAYWRGDEKNLMLTRVYGVAFTTEEELKKHLELQEKAKENDHRKLGRELDLFFITEDVGAGLPLLKPRGEVIKNLLMRYMRQEEVARGYQYVSTPVLTQEKLYQRSGHADHYLEDMYATDTDEEGNKFYIKPMNCPHHHMIYEDIVQSYRDLPLKLSEHSGLYRNELSGTLTGLIRMRGPITQNDSHTYLTKGQLAGEFRDLIQFFDSTYKIFGLEDYWFRVSLPDFTKPKFEGDKKEWQFAAKTITDSLDELGAKYSEEVGEAAFYGPKLDVQIKNVNGKEDSIATVQIDVLVPGKMGLSFVDEDGNKQTPIVIHKSIMGAFERFFGFLLEKTGGHLPFWLAPEQIRILSINDTVAEYVEQITSVLSETVLMTPLKYNELRYTIDDRNESLGKKIKEATQLKIPVQLIVGPRDQQAAQVSVRVNGQESKVDLSALKEFIEQL